jgi:hypothetical protein
MIAPFCGRKGDFMLRRVLTLAAGVVLIATGGASASTPGADVRLSHDCLNRAGDPFADPIAQPAACAGGGYVSAYTLATGTPYTDKVLDECSVARGRQNEPSVAVNPRDTRVLIGSANDYCGVFANGLSATGPVWLGYYRSENSGSSFVSSLVPGYPDDTSPFASLAHVRTSGAGDPVIAWDTHGRVFMGAEASGDPSGTKAWGDVWVARFVNPAGPAGITLNDGKLFAGSETVAQGASSFGGKFHDKTAIEVDRTGGRCDGNVYFSWSRFTGASAVGFNASVYFVRSTDHGVTFSSPVKLSQTVHDIQFPDIAVTGNGNVYITFRQFESVPGQEEEDSIFYVKSTDCGATFSNPQLIAEFTPYDPTDIADPQPIPSPSSPEKGHEGESPENEAGPAQGERTVDCGDFAFHCESGYTFARAGTQIRSAGDAFDPAHEFVYIVYDPTKPGTEVASGSSFGTIASADLPAKLHQRVGSQAGVYFIRLDGSTGTHTAPRLLDDEPRGHQIFPDISADGAVLHTIWWDSRLDACYDPRRPIGNCADRTVVPALDVFASTSTDRGATWSAAMKVTDVTTNPNYEQFSNRAIPFAGDYLWVTSLGSFSFGTWTDWRNTRQGVDAREGAGDSDGATADVRQCREPSTIEGKKGATSTVWSSDLCPHAGGLDQNIYGDKTP